MATAKHGTIYIIETFYHVQQLPKQDDIYHGEWRPVAGEPIFQLKADATRRARALRNAWKYIRVTEYQRGAAGNSSTQAEP